MSRTPWVPSVCEGETLHRILASLMPRSIPGHRVSGCSEHHDNFCQRDGLGASFPVNESSSHNKDLISSARSTKGDVAMFTGKNCDIFEIAGRFGSVHIFPQVQLRWLGSLTTEIKPRQKLGKHHGARRRRFSLRQQQPLQSTNRVRRKPLQPTGTHSHTAVATPATVLNSCNAAANLKTRRPAYAKDHGRDGAAPDSCRNIC